MLQLSKQHNGFLSGWAARRAFESCACAWNLSWPGLCLTRLLCTPCNSVAMQFGCAFLPLLSSAYTARALQTATATAPRQPPVYCGHPWFCRRRIGRTVSQVGCRRPLVACRGCRRRRLLYLAVRLCADCAAQDGYAPGLRAAAGLRREHTGSRSCAMRSSAKPPSPAQCAGWGRGCVCLALYTHPCAQSA